MSLLESELSSLSDNEDESLNFQHEDNIQPLEIRSLSEEVLHKINSIEMGKNSSKVNVRFQPIGSTPSINPRVVKVSSSYSISSISKFLVQKLKIKDKTINIYIQNTFQPSPDENLGQLYDLFKTNNELIINYCHKVAFG